MPSLPSWSLILLFAPRLIHCQYQLQKDYFQSNFFDSFDFFDGADPTNGFVQYSGRDDSLISSSSNNAQMHVSTEQSTPGGRPSIRITSQESYESGLIVLDLAHMPGGQCGTWPAFWTVGPNWPAGGEIDIIEGVNDGQTNQMTLHTGSTCSISNSQMTGSLSTDNCDVSNGDNTGCGITTTNAATYGSGFNANGGGIYATLLSSTNIIVWFWPRGSEPSDVLSAQPDPLSWSTPLANFSGSCDFDTSFAAQQIVFDTTFCGDWAGEVWSSGGCAAKASTCEDYVANNGNAFTDAYWSINALRVYAEQSGSTPSSPVPSVSPSTPPSASTPAATTDTPASSVTTPSVVTIPTVASTPDVTPSTLVVPSSPASSPIPPASTPVPPASAPAPQISTQVLSATTFATSVRSRSHSAFGAPQGFPTAFREHPGAPSPGFPLGRFAFPPEANRRSIGKFDDCDE